MLLESFVRVVVSRMFKIEREGEIERDDIG